MASNIPGGLNFGALNACVIRAARLDSDCSPTGGADTGLVSAGLVTLTADPVVSEGTTFEQKNSCGNVLFNYTEDDKLTGWTFNGELAFWDPEIAALLFGGSVIAGAVGGDFAGKSIGYAAPLYNAPPRNGTYLEIITTYLVEGAGNCVSAASGVPVAFGHIFGKVKLVQGSIPFANDIIRVAFTGKGTNNPNLFNGPWNDYPGAGYTPNTSYAYVGYSQTQYDAILAAVNEGWQTLPAGS
jgi:hypothetical protein